MKALKIDTNYGMCAMRDVDIVGDTIAQQNDSIRALLNGYFDIVRIAHDAAMLVDDDGIMKGLPINWAAMMIANHPQLVGTALIVGLEPTPDGDVFTDYPQRYIVEALRCGFF